MGCVHPGPGACRAPPQGLLVSLADGKTRQACPSRTRLGAAPSLAVPWRLARLGLGTMKEQQAGQRWSPNLLHPRGVSGVTGSLSTGAELSRPGGEVGCVARASCRHLCIQGLRAPRSSLGGTGSEVTCLLLSFEVCHVDDGGFGRGGRGPSLSCCLVLHRSACSSRTSSFGAIGQPRWTPGGLQPSAPPTCPLWLLWVQM